MVDTTNIGDNDGDNTSNRDFIENHVNKMIHRIRTFLNPQHGNTTPEEEEAAGAATKVKKVLAVNPATKKYAELRIKILQDSPRDADELKEILQAKEEEYEKVQGSERIERLITEIDMLKYLLFLVNREERQRRRETLQHSG